MVETIYNSGIEVSEDHDMVAPKHELEYSYYEALPPLWRKFIQEFPMDASARDAYVNYYRNGIDLTYYARELLKSYDEIRKYERQQGKQMLVDCFKRR